MSGMVIERFIEDNDYIEYTIIHEDGSFGSASLRITELDSTHHMTAILQKEERQYRNRIYGSNVAELFFYPHSTTSVQRSGIGHQVLDYVLKDAREKQIKVVYCEITNSIAQQFFQKCGFKGDYAPHCYKIIL